MICWGPGLLRGPRVPHQVAWGAAHPPDRGAGLGHGRPSASGQMAAFPRGWPPGAVTPAPC